MGKSLGEVLGGQKPRVPLLGGVVLVVCARQLPMALTVTPRWLGSTAETANSPPEADNSTPSSDCAEALAKATVR
jgi:hypothetical protein